MLVPVNAFDVKGPIDRAFNGTIDAEVEGANVLRVRVDYLYESPDTLNGGKGTLIPINENVQFDFGGSRKWHASL